MNRDRAITLIIVLNFMIVLLLGVNYNVTNPTKINKIIANSYKTPVNKAFIDQNFYNCIIDNYNRENNSNLSYTTNITNEQLNSIKILSCPKRSISSISGLQLLKNIEALYLGYNNINEIDVKSNLKLKILDLGLNESCNFYSNGYSCSSGFDKNNNIIEKIDLSNNVNLEELYIFNNGLKKLDINKNINLKKLSVYKNKLNELSIDNNQKLMFLDVRYNNLKKINLNENVNLEKLYLDNNEFDSVNLNNNMLLTEFSASHNKLINIDLSNNTLLTKFSAIYNKLVNIDLSNNMKLLELGLSNNEFKELDISNNTNLTKLFLSSNELTNLNLDNNQKLIHVDVSLNKLTKLNVKKNIDLLYLSLNNNMLESIDLSNNNKLFDLSIYNNKLTNLDVSNNINLSSLRCGNHYMNIKGSNLLTSIDLSKNINLLMLDISFNQLTHIDLSSNLNLLELYVNNNKLSSLDISKNINIKKLVATENSFELGEEIVYKGKNIDLSSKISSNNYKLNNNFEKDYKYSMLNSSVLNDSVINNENVGKYDYKLFFKGDNSYNNISGIYRVYVTELTSKKYRINEEKGYIYTGADIDKKTILSNLNTAYGTLEITGNKLQIKNGKNVIKNFNLLNLTSTKYKINEEKEYIYTELDINKETILSNLSTTYGMLQINDNKLQIIDEKNVIKEFKILNLSSMEYELNSDYIYTSIKEFNKDNIVTDCVLSIKDNLVEISYDNKILDTFKLISITSTKYKITDKYVYIDGNIDLNNINITNGNIKLNSDKLEIIYNDLILDSLDILNMDFGALKISNNVIVIIKEISYKEFIDEIKVFNVSYKIYKEEKEVTNGNIEKGMTLKVVSEKYGIIEEYKITNEYIDVSKINIEKNNFINDFVVEDTYKNILDKIDTSGEIKIIDNIGKELTSNDNVRTGSKIRIELTTETKEYTIVVLGDVTGTGKTTMADVMKTANYLLDNSVIKEECYKKAADVTKDGDIKISDVMKLANYVLNGKF